VLVALSNLTLLYAVLDAEYSSNQSSATLFPAYEGILTSLSPAESILLLESGFLPLCKFSLGFSGKDDLGLILFICATISASVASFLNPYPSSALFLSGD